MNTQPIICAATMDLDQDEPDYAEPLAGMPQSKHGDIVQYCERLEVENGELRDQLAAAKAGWQEAWIAMNDAEPNIYGSYLCDTRYGAECACRTTVPSDKLRRVLVKFADQPGQPESVEPIPDGVWWTKFKFSESGVFSRIGVDWDMDDPKQCEEYDEFYYKWYPRRAEFPQSRKEAKRQQEQEIAVVRDGVYKDGYTFKKVPQPEACDKCGALADDSGKIEHVDQCVFDAEQACDVSGLIRKLQDCCDECLEEEACVLADTLNAEFERLRDENFKLRRTIGHCCQCRFDKGEQVEECHLHECQRCVRMENGDPSDVTLLERVAELETQLAERETEITERCDELDVWKDTAVERLMKLDALAAEHDARGAEILRLKRELQEAASRAPQSADLERLKELERQATAWIVARNSHSSNCAKINISSSIKDTWRWVDELTRAEEPFRRFMEDYLENKPTTTTPQPNPWREPSEVPQDGSIVEFCTNENGKNIFICRYDNSQAYPFVAHHPDNEGWNRYGVTRWRYAVSEPEGERFVGWIRKPENDDRGYLFTKDQVTEIQQPATLYVRKAK